MKNSKQENPERRSNNAPNNKTNKESKNNRIPSVKSVFSNPQLYYRFFILLFIIAIIVIRFFLPVKSIVVVGDNSSQVSENIDDNNDVDNNNDSGSVVEGSSVNNSDEQPQKDDTVSKAKEAKNVLDVHTNANYEQLLRCRVTKISDGDTLYASAGAGCPSGRIRMIGVDTPETVSPSKPVQCFGPEASEYTKQLLGQYVYLEMDETQGDLDVYDRLLRYIYTSDGVNWNMKLIAEGYGREYTFNTAYIYQTQFKQAQANAKSAALGLWAPNTCNGGT